MCCELLCSVPVCIWM